ncbi:MAG TPA: hypothetical protein PKY13_10400 [Microthrixaceae bacterium]|nr:hypothetical protein [Microthrixaceae bacterium]
MHRRETHRRRFRRARLIAGITLAAVVTAGVAGCGDEPRDGDSAVAVTASTVAPGGVNALADPEKVPILIREHLGESPEIRRLSLNSNGFSVQVRDPAKRDNMDDYDFYNGTWTTRPVSVSVSEIEAYESVTFYLGDISWEKIPGLIDQALTGLDLEGEEVGNVGFDRLAGERPRVYIGVNGLRGNGRLIARADGTEVDIQRN